MLALEPFLALGGEPLEAFLALGQVGLGRARGLGRLRVDDANGRIVICWYSTWRTSMAKKPIQIDAVSYYSLDDRGFVEAHEVDRVEINGKRRSPETAWERLQELVAGGPGQMYPA